MTKKIRGILSKFDQAAIRNLVKSGSYREFIARAMALRSGNRKRLSYADLARRAGFSARSFPRSVAIGTRGITPSSLNPFIHGLGITGDLAEFFRLLVELEVPECRSRRTDQSSLRKQITNLRGRMLSGERFSGASRAEDAAFQSRFVPRIYAALGTSSEGATVDEIQKRTRLPVKTVSEILKAMAKAELLLKNEDRYFAVEKHLNFAGLTKNEVFKHYFLNLAKEISKEAETAFESDEKLYFSSAFSINSRDIPILKEELRSLLLRFVDKVEVGAGDRVASLLCALF